MLPQPAGHKRQVSTPRIKRRPNMLDVGMLDTRNPKAIPGIKKDSAKFREITDPKNIFKDRK